MKREQRKKFKGEDGKGKMQSHSSKASHAEGTGRRKEEGREKKDYLEDECFWNKISREASYFDVLTAKKKRKEKKEEEERTEEPWMDGCIINDDMNFCPEQSESQSMEGK